ncbi:hypothetical protein [Ancylobacter polymorphus]|uniref:Uncharacterized protein n=1 Tax=Ancylobacter polymorphus TaxID=223390 RepID=A0ABU0BJX8_9HYPH|nr:hypothetical protein [Ancylobacter polymorphus]MDQ0305332.1 hypothetical protein [Ancylobacter polymorphus]
MSPEQALSALDRALAAHGQNATLRRYTGTGPSRTASDVTVRVRLDDYRPEELVGGIIQGDSRVILSPSQIIAASWGGTPADGTDGRVPVKNDQIIVAGRARIVQAPVPFYIDGQLVRIELQVRG